VLMRLCSRPALVPALEQKPHSASVVTTMPCEVLVLSRPDFALHIEPRCGAPMLHYADQWYIDSIHDDGTSSICGSIATSFRWASYKQRVLADAISGRVLDTCQHDALDPSILECAGEPIAGIRIRDRKAGGRARVPSDNADFPIRLHSVPHRSAKLPPALPSPSKGNASPRDFSPTRASKFGAAALPSPRGHADAASSPTTPRLPRLPARPPFPPISSSLGASPRPFREEEDGMSHLAPYHSIATPRRTRLRMEHQPRYSKRGAGMAGPAIDAATKTRQPAAPGEQQLVPPLDLTIVDGGIAMSVATIG
jgi:hypothetical protein